MISGILITTFFAFFATIYIICGGITHRKFEEITKSVKEEEKGLTTLVIIVFWPVWMFLRLGVVLADKFSTKRKSKKSIIIKEHHDSRGDIYWLEVAGKKFNVIFSKAGSKRSGDIHPNTQFDYVVSGSVTVTTPTAHKASQVLGKNDVVIIARKVPHLFEFNEDTVLVEYWGGPFEAEYYKPYRDIIDASLKDTNA